ncbi:RNA methyltransferase [Candidatus Woesearchaeota archaeon]|nr:RNA methyltransferase [Candidatus Woesearchaeota archaeon]MBW3022323.1 RNA methyltransferase [Candidatus Woesearchaeota archaeon]
MISIILVEPETPGNIGAVARVMKNFDFVQLVLVNPKCDYLDLEAEKRAKHAEDIVRSARVVDDLDGYDYLIATTSKMGTDYNIPRSSLTPSEFASLIKDKDANIGIVFGRESAGLTNDEISKCDYCVAIPSSRNYPALNLSHSVGIILYELYKIIGVEKITDHFVAISGDEKRQMLKLLEQVLDRLEFATEEKKETQRLVWKHIFGKAMLTKRESFAVMGFLKKLL